ncbi:cellulase family glycosylhydrolase [candidate division KSB1 bacterium]|nr:cellulase family glycosylhydrolase [candidate division KSB1 bacterium]
MRFQPKYFWFFEGFCGMWASGPRSVRQASAASLKINELKPQAAPESAGSTRTLKEPNFLVIIFLICMVIHTKILVARDFQFITARENYFELKGFLVKLIGVNYFPYCECWPPMPWLKYSERITESDFRKIESLGINTVRVFLTYSFYDLQDNIDEQQIKKLDHLLESAKKYNLYVMLVGPTNWEGVPEWAKNNKFNNEKFIDKFADLMTLIAYRYRNNANLFAIDLYNEPRINYASNGGEVAEDWIRKKEEIASNWVRRLVKRIKNANQNILITLGLSQSSFPIGLKSTKYYSGFRLKNIIDSLDFVQFHFYPKYLGIYNYKDNRTYNASILAFNWIIDVVKKYRKPIVIGEFGWYGGGQVFIKGQPLEDATENQQLDYVESIISVGGADIAGWYNWAFYDMPLSKDVTHKSGMLSSKDQVKTLAKHYKNLIIENTSKKEELNYGVTEDLWNKLISVEGLSLKYLNSLNDK